MKEIIKKQKKLLNTAIFLIRQWHGMGMSSEQEEMMWKIYNTSPEMKRLNEGIEAVESELAVLEAEQGIDLPPVEQSSQGEGMMSAKDYCCEWHDKKYGGCKEIGDWSPDDVMEFAEEYAAKKMLNILPKQNIPKECTLCKYHPTNNRW